MYYNLHTHIFPKREQKNVCSFINLQIENISEITCSKNNLLNYSVGIHPWNADNETLEEGINFIEKYAHFPSVKAIGECGLDKLCKTDLERQKRAFLSQILISEKVNKPLIVHCVKSFDEIIAFKKRLQPKQPWIIHGFRGKPEQAFRFIQSGLFLSFGFNYNEDAIKIVPPEKIFLETDNSAHTIQVVYEKVAATLNIEGEKLIRQIETNVKSVFSISNVC